MSNIYDNLKNFVKLEPGMDKGVCRGCWIAVEKCECKKNLCSRLWIRIKSLYGGSQ